MQGYEQVVEKLQRSTVQVLNGNGGGSGVVWAPGLIVTNAHVASGGHAEIVDHRGRRTRAAVTKLDPERDLALIEIAGLDLPPAETGDSAVLRSGQIVLAVGHPLGMTGAVAAGIIHAVGPLGFGARKNWIQADLRLAPGNSGGVLADAQGRVIGINTMIFHGIGLAIPSRDVSYFLLRNSRSARAA